MDNKKSVLDLVKQYVNETAPINATEKEKKKMIDAQVILLLRV
ncbi:MAG: hypothetical protein ACOWWR_09170 [Eubacteriales bacterium]